MDTRRFLCFFFLSLCIALALLFTWAHLPYRPPYAADLLDCSTNSAWCSSKNRLQSKPPNPTRRLRDHASDTPTTLSTPSPSQRSPPSAPSSPPTLYSPPPSLTRSTPSTSKSPTSPSSSAGTTATPSSLERPPSSRVW
ncbi:primary amine oxidase [Prunus yedoensis var. nudiflora]|uniref:Primary amine oxidase n=1 Tax=Prunus yedoensis var. nudiflora TaxID=2094558 RepID=A0A314UIF0_PRUYE|nr:primary amine oxidase [Prunus yedoensis var. nudiflora]